jgi:ATP-dependent helicase IRC3
VSGTPGHLPAHSIKVSDDVVIVTLQTMARAMQNLSGLPGLKSWLKDASNLVVVFDEAHHSPAPSYRELLATLRKSHPDLLLLALTATPTYSDKSKSGWLKKLFPQEILHQVSPKKLMLNGVLAKPIFEGHETNITPEWNEREYQKWLGTYADLPETIISHLAENRSRNAFIAQTYADNCEKYGKTIIFAERKSRTWAAATRHCGGFC